MHYLNSGNLFTEECKLKPKPLYPGQSAFFQVQPRYVNVDIRVFIDVMQGSLDLYMSLRDDSLVVSVNSTSGQHFVGFHVLCDFKCRRSQFYFLISVNFVSVGMGSEV